MITSEFQPCLTRLDFFKEHNRGCRYVLVVSDILIKYTVEKKTHEKNRRDQFINAVYTTQRKITFIQFKEKSQKKTIAVFLPKFSNNEI